MASVSTEIPQFTSGRAAVLVRAVTKDQAAELRRIIHPANKAAKAQKAQKLNEEFSCAFCAFLWLMKR